MKVTCDYYGEAVELIRIVGRNAVGEPVCVGGKWVVNVLSGKKDPKTAHDRNIKAEMLKRWRQLSRPDGLKNWHGRTCPIYIDNGEDCCDCRCNCFQYWHTVRKVSGEKLGPGLAKEILKKVKEL